MNQARQTIPCNIRRAQNAGRERVPVLFAYRADAPFVVRLFTEDGPARTISRELLALGCGAWTGEGRVKAYPVGALLRLDFVEPGAVVTYEMLRANVDRFLGQTYRIRSVQADDPSEDPTPEVVAAVDRLIASFDRRPS